MRPEVWQKVGCDNRKNQYVPIASKGSTLRLWLALRRGPRSTPVVSRILIHFRSLN
jgi:hypothetical protein